MARYDYQCDECSEIFEEEHPMSYEGPVICPVCGTGLTHKVIIQTPGIWVYWKDARSSSNVTLPKYLRPVSRKRREEESPEDFGGV